MIVKLLQVPQIIHDRSKSPIQTERVLFEAKRSRTWRARVPCDRSQSYLRYILDVSLSPHLLRFEVVEIEALSIQKNFYHQSDIDAEEKILFRVELRKPRFRRQRVWKQVKVEQIPMTKADFFLRIFEAIPGTLKRSETLYNVETLWKSLKNDSPNTLWKRALKCRVKNIILVCVHYPHAGEYML